jgi:hypothetical protein
VFHDNQETIMKKIVRLVLAIASASVFFVLHGSASAADDSRVTYYKNQVHLNADQLRARSKELAAWQKSNWVAPRICTGTSLSWASVPAGKSAELYDCAPFQCSTDGLCKQECSTDANCAAGARCLDTDASGKNGVCAVR